MDAVSGRTYSYFNKRNYEYIGLGFSKEIKYAMLTNELYQELSEENEYKEQKQIKQ